jgi:D-alanyl-D-alanine dipeptidase
MKREVLDRLIFAAAFANAKGGHRIVVGIARRTLRQQAELWNWRLVERFAALVRHRKGEDPARLARLARPVAEVANPRRFGCSSPHLTGSAVDVQLLARDGTPLVTFRRRFFYATKKAYRKRFLLADSDDARHARLLEELMYSAGFVRYCREGWHFETGASPLHKFWAAAGKPGRCFGAGRGGTWDPRREPGEDRIGDMMAGLPRI